jgi:quercetin dioxygenase-like cupin family protein
MAKPLALLSTLAALSLGIFTLSSAQAQQLPRSFVASPDIYKVAAQNEQYKVIAVTWKAGQKDSLHSHPASAVYYLTDCSLRIHAQDGSYRDVQPKAGHAFVQAPIPAHALENLGTTDCRLVMFEPS